MFGGLIGPVVGGFNAESDKIRAENTDKANRDQDRDRQIAETLVNNEDLPDEVRHAALTHLLVGTKDGKQGGLAKWYGQQEAHPLFPIAQMLMGSGNKFTSAAERGAKAQVGAKNDEANDLDKRLSGMGATPQQRIDAQTPGAPPRVFAPQPHTVAYQDEAGTQQTAGVNYDPNTGKYTWATGPKAGQPFEYQIKRFLTATGSMNPNVTYHNVSGEDPFLFQLMKRKPASGIWSVPSNIPHEMLTEGDVREAPTPPPAAVIQGTGGPSIVDRSGGSKPVTGPAGGPPAVPPEQGANIHEQALKRVETRANDQGIKSLPRQRTDPNWMKIADQAAQEEGYKSYADLKQQQAEAGKAVTGRVAQPPPKTNTGDDFESRINRRLARTSSAQPPPK